MRLRLVRIFFFVFSDRRHFLSDSRVDHVKLLLVMQEMVVRLSILKNNQTFYIHHPASSILVSSSLLNDTLFLQFIATKLLLIIKLASDNILLSRLSISSFFTPRFVCLSLKIISRRIIMPYLKSWITVIPFTMSLVKVINGYFVKSLHFHFHFLSEWPLVWIGRGIPRP